MKKPIGIVVNGVGFNCEVVASLTEEQFVAKYMGRKFQRTSIPERERLLRDVYKECVAKVSPPSNKDLPVGTEVVTVTPEKETTEEPPKENKKGKGRTSPEKTDKGGL